MAVSLPDTSLHMANACSDVTGNSAAMLGALAMQSLPTTVGAESAASLKASTTSWQSHGRFVEVDEYKIRSSCCACNDAYGRPGMGNGTGGIIQDIVCVREETC